MSNNERTAIKMALALLTSNNWDGNDEFSRGMKMLKKAAGKRYKNPLTKRPKSSTISKQCN